MTFRATLSRRSLLTTLCILALLLAAQPGWPGKPVHIVVADPAGGMSDAIARLLGEKLAVQLGQPVLDRLNAEINEALALPDVRSRLVASDNVPTGGKAGDFARLIAANRKATRG